MPTICTPEELLGRKEIWTMYEDPIVKEVRKAGELLAKNSDYDVHKFFEQLRKTQKKHRNLVINKADLHKVDYGMKKESI